MQFVSVTENNAQITTVSVYQLNFLSAECDALYWSSFFKLFGLLAGNMNINALFVGEATLHSVTAACKLCKSQLAYHLMGTGCVNRPCCSPECENVPFLCANVNLTECNPCFLECDCFLCAAFQTLACNNSIITTLMTAQKSPSSLRPTNCSLFEKSAVDDNKLSYF